ncbi:MAG: GntR family transcriptional regulator [Spirochaetaceae bacterium]|nr:GntR family transcriptional regulator [Spirochaetaceae bacterium]
MEFETSSIRIYRKIRKDIVLGKLAPGGKLTRRTLGKEYGVSPITIMEALYKLEFDGLVESQPMYGTRVRPLTREYFEGEQVMREALECQSARLCAQNMDNRSAEKLEELAEFLDNQNGEDPSEGMTKHEEFHVAIAAAGGSGILMTEIEKIFYREFMWATWRNAKHFKNPDGWHNTLLAALKTGDPEQAEAAMRKHVIYNSEKLLDLLESGNEEI